jgi:hypothetical protein
LREVLSEAEYGLTYPDNVPREYIDGVHATIRYVWNVMTGQDLTWQEICDDKALGDENSDFIHNLLAETQKAHTDGIRALGGKK